MIRVLVVSALAFSLAGLAACAHHPHHHAPGSTVAACDATQYQSLVGTDESALNEFALPSNHRVVCFGCMATMEYDANRLTIYMGPGHKVASVHCS